MIDWLGQKVGVYGYGKTGRACVDFLGPRLIRPTVLVDEADPIKLAALRSAAGERCDIVGADGLMDVIERLDSLILSPGVPQQNAAVVRARERGILIISELELASRFCQGYVLAITGTNGKSTTTKLLGHILSGVAPTHVLGNIGSPLLGSLGEISGDDFVALEVSSFQLEAIDRFAPRVAIYTNLTPDHLDRHGSLKEYARVKRSMTQRMTEADFVITNAESPEFAPRTFPNQRPSFLQYSAGAIPEGRGAWIDGDSIVYDLGREQHTLPRDCIKLPGRHNVENALAASLAALLVGATTETVRERLSTFTGYEHRLELCRRTPILSFYNDSKATNPEATITALKSMHGALVVILGGRDKLTPLDELVKYIIGTSTGVVLIGEAAARFEEALRQNGYNALVTVAGLDEAVPAALETLGAGGGTVLLSPACASFDQYESYEARGEHFKQIVTGLNLEG